MPLVLTVVGGPHLGKSFVFTERDNFLVGRAPDVHFPLQDDDRYFSRIHFMVEVNPPRCRVFDLNSRNGTYVNGQRVQSAELKTGDEIKAGHTLLRLCATDNLPTTLDSISPPPPPAAAPEKAGPPPVPPRIDAGPPPLPPAIPGE